MKSVQDEVFAAFPLARKADETDNSFSFYLGLDGWYFTVTDPGKGKHVVGLILHPKSAEVEEVYCRGSEVVEEVRALIQNYIHEWQGDIDRLQAKVDELQDCI